MKNIFVLSKIPGLADAIRRCLPSAHIKSDEWLPCPNSAVAEAMKSAEVLVLDSDVFARYMPYLENAKWVQLTWAGVDSLVASSKEWKEFPPYPVTRYSGSHMGVQMAEYVVGQIISRERAFPQQRDFQRDKHWGIDDVKKYKAIGDLTISVLGIGHIGREVAKTLKVFGATIYGVARTKRLGDESGCWDEIRVVEELAEVLRVSDYIVSILPNTPETTNLLGNGTLKACARQPVLINVGRGNVIQETDISEALEKGWISGAILDVFQEEPLPQSSILWSLPKVVITPHVSATSRPQDVAAFFADNFKLYEKGQQPFPRIDWERGY